jgi:hypothetical protein
VAGSLPAPHPQYGVPFGWQHALNGPHHAETLRRMYARTEDRDQATNWATREAQWALFGKGRRLLAESPQGGDGTFRRL